MIQGASVNVTDLGSDANTSIPAAINSLSSTGGTVFLPKGTYTISAPLTVTVSNIAIVGEPGTIITITGTNVQNIFRFSSVNNVSIRGIEFTTTGTLYDNVGVTWFNNYALFFTKTSGLATGVPCTNIRIEDCYFNEICAFTTEWVQYGTLQDSWTEAYRYSDFVFSHNKVKVYAVKTAQAIYTYFMSRYEISGNVFDVTGIYAMGIAGGSPGATINTSNYGSVLGRIHSNAIKCQSQAGIALYAADQTVISGNNLDMGGGTGEGIDFENCKNCIADANTIYNTSKPFGLFYQWDNITISNNVVTLKLNALFFLQGSSSPAPSGTVMYGDLNIVNNHVSQLPGTLTSYSSLTMGGGSKVTISGNQFKNVSVLMFGGQGELQVTGNTFEFSALPANASANRIVLGYLKADYYLAHQITVSNNVFRSDSATVLAGYMLETQYSSTAGYNILIQGNTFSHIASPLFNGYGSCAGSSYVLYRNNVLDSVTYGFTQGNLDTTALSRLFISGLVSPSGLDYFQNTTNFGTVQATQGNGCANGSSITTSAPTTGQPMGWINISTTGSTNWRSTGNLA
jgi:hypothetical protein